MKNSHWNTIDSKDELDSLIHTSHESDQLIFKHSNRCGISSLVKNRLGKEVSDSADVISIRLIDVINNRALSNQISEYFSVQHESPQLLVISGGKCIFHTSHFDISLKNIPV